MRMHQSRPEELPMKRQTMPAILSVILLLAALAPRGAYAAEEGGSKFKIGVGGGDHVLKLTPAMKRSAIGLYPPPPKGFAIKRISVTDPWSCAVTSRVTRSERGNMIPTSV